MLVEVGFFDKGNLKNGYKTWRIPQDSSAFGFVADPQNLCVSMKYSNFIPVWVYVGECIFNFLPHGHGVMQQLRFKASTAPAAQAAAPAGAAQGVAPAAAAQGVAQQGAAQAPAAQPAAAQQAVAQPAAAQAAAPESKVKNLNWLGQWWLGERYIGAYVDQNTGEQTFASEFVHNAYKDSDNDPRLPIAVRRGGEFRTFRDDGRLALAYEWAMYLNHNKIQTTDHTPETNYTKESMRGTLANERLFGEIRAPETMFAGGKKEEHPHSKRMYEIAQMMKELAGGKNKEHLAELHLQAGQLLKEASHGIEMDRQTQMQVRQSSPIPPPPGLLGGGGGFGNDTTTSLAERQQLVSDFKMAAIQTLMGGSHRRVLGNEVANILCQQYV